MYYSPSVVSAFSSVLNIVGQVHLGWLNRSIHRWSGSSMVSALILHAFRVYLTGVPEGLDKLLFGVGLLLVLIIRGGFSVSSGRLTRFYSIHTFLLPIVTLSLVIIHFIQIRKQGISGPL